MPESVRAAVIPLVLTLLFMLLGPALASAQPWNGTITTHSYTNAAGARQYGAYVPAGRRAVNRPVLVYLHGCWATSGPEDALRGSGLLELADRRGFVVVAPVQPNEGGRASCWNSSQPWNQVRDSGEPSIIAGITREIAAREQADPKRIYVTGFSSGGAMTTVMGATYPDLYAAIAPFAGCGYLSCVDITGIATRLAMGDRARPMPVLIGHGSADLLVAQLAWPHLRQWLHANFLAGERFALWPDAVRQHPGGALSYQVETFNDRQGCAMVKFLTVHGGGHTWFRGSPDYPTELTNFLLNYRLGEPPRVCGPRA